MWKISTMHSLCVIVRTQPPYNLTPIKSGLYCFFLLFRHVSGVVSKQCDRGSCWQWTIDVVYRRFRTVPDVFSHLLALSPPTKLRYMLLPRVCLSVCAQDMSKVIDRFEENYVEASLFQHWEIGYISTFCFNQKILACSHQSSYVITCVQKCLALAELLALRVPPSNYCYY